MTTRRAVLLLAVALTALLAWTVALSVSYALNVLTSPLIFRYSAITWNAHRIHYDADYARGAEGYPNTVHNGGLTMHLIIDAALKRAPGELTGYTARLARPLFVGDTLTMAGHAARDGKMGAWGADKEGALCAQLDLEFAA